MPGMIVTHTQNATGQCRIYLGGKGRLECWIDPDADKTGWTFHVEEAIVGNHFSDSDKRTWAIHTLLQLATELNVAPDDLATVSFEVIAALHSTDPFVQGRSRMSAGELDDVAHVGGVKGIERPVVVADGPEPGAGLHEVIQ